MVPIAEQLFSQNLFAIRGELGLEWCWEARTGNFHIDFGLILTFCLFKVHDYISRENALETKSICLNDKREATPPVDRLIKCPF